MAFEYLTIHRTGVSIATTAASASSALPIDSAGKVPCFVRIAATAPACVRLGPTGLTALTTDVQIQPGDAIRMSTNGATFVAAIQVSGPGVVQVSPIENT